MTKKLEIYSFLELIKEEGLLNIYSLPRAWGGSNWIEQFDSELVDKNSKICDIAYEGSINYFVQNFGSM